VFDSIYGSGSDRKNVASHPEGQLHRIGVEIVGSLENEYSDIQWESTGSGESFKLSNTITVFE
jgi:hypothetical protein